MGLKLLGDFLAQSARAFSFFYTYHFFPPVRMYGMCKDRRDMIPDSQCRTDRTTLCKVWVLSSRVVPEAGVLFFRG